METDARGVLVLNRFFDAIEALEAAFTHTIAAKPSTPDAVQTRYIVLAVAGALAAVFGAAGYKVPRAFAFVQMALIGLAVSVDLPLVGISSANAICALGAGLVGALAPKTAVVAIASVAVNRTVYTQWELPLAARLVVPQFLTAIFAKAVHDDADVSTYVLVLSAIQGADVLQQLVLGLLKIDGSQSTLVAGLLMFVQAYLRMPKAPPHPHQD
ncbi:hypothetical protein ACHHYP_10252 [Achlya hypogyna]|uniref:Uncharacterized protein n=1 Tax=Achlya hypogyna TaxID=1202772 RepID=A0A1V9YLV3_ACHHY|nr:hypothetical protein ACHHYP_10252 [Achlya hypogyna]